MEVFENPFMLAFIVLTIIVVIGSALINGGKKALNKITESKGVNSPLWDN